MGWCHFEVTHGTQYLVVIIGITELATIISPVTGITGSIELVDWRRASWVWDPVTILLNHCVLDICGISRWRTLGLWLGMGGLSLRCWCHYICQRKLFLPFQEGSSTASLTTEIWWWSPGFLGGFWRASFTWQRKVETRSQPQRERKLTTFVFQCWADLQALCD